MSLSKSSFASAMRTLRTHPYALVTLGVFLLLDTVFLLLALVGGDGGEAFHLDREQNFPTYYQGLKLALVGCVVFASAILARLSGGPARALLPYALGFIYLALDEVGQIHENMPQRLVEAFGPVVASYQEFFFSRGFDSAEWLLFYWPFFIAAPFYFAYLALRYTRGGVRPWHVSFFIMGVFLFICIPAIEFLNMRPGVFGTDDFFAWTMLEEYTEMLGATFFLTFHSLLVGSQLRRLG